MREKMLEILSTTNCMVTPNGDFVIANTWEEVNEIVEKANQEFSENAPWKFDDIVEEITGDRDEWGFSDEYSYCDNCGRVFNYYSYHGGPEYWFDTQTSDELCAECVRNEFPEDYLDFLIDNPEEQDWFLGEKVLKEFGFELLQEEDTWKFNVAIDHYQELRKTHKEGSVQIVFGQRDVRNGYYYRTVWLRDVGEI